MGLQDFKKEDVDEGEKYYSMTVKGEAIVIHPSVYDSIPRQARELIDGLAEYTEDFCKVHIPFEFTVRGHTRESVFNASRRKMENIEDQVGPDNIAEVLRVKTSDEEIEEHEKDW